MEIKQGDLVLLTFDPSEGDEIQKRRPALVMSRDEYNFASNLIIVCPITSTAKERPYFVPVKNIALTNNSKVNTKQVYSLDYTDEAERHVKVIGKIETTEFLNIAQHFMLNFNFSFL